jgi:hypothetical protein
MNITDDDLKQDISTAMASLQIPIDERGVYTVILRGDFSLLYKGFRWPNDFCSYHSAFYTPDQRLIKYVVVGDPSTSRPLASNCIPISDGPTANGNLGGDSIVTEYAKNLADTVTGYSGAWYSDTTRYGSGFSCSGNYGNGVNVNWNMLLGGKPFLVQQVNISSDLIELYCEIYFCTRQGMAASYWMRVGLSAPHTSTLHACHSSTYYLFQPGHCLPQWISHDWLVALLRTLQIILYYYFVCSLLFVGPIKLYNIFLGDFNSTLKLRNETALINYFTSHIGGSDWFNVLTAYYQKDSSNVMSYVSNSAQLVTSIVVPLGAGVTSLTETIIQSKLKALITSGKLPADANGVYNIIFRGELSVSSEGLGLWGSDWCSLHGATTTSSGVMLKYTLAGDPSTQQRCLPPISARPTANQLLGADSVVSELANALAGAVTNSDGNGWYFSDYSDVGDACFGNYGAASGFYGNNANIKLGSKWFLIQQNWLPKYGCRMAK